MGIFDKGVKESYDRLVSEQLSMSRYVRDTINKNDDTRELYRLLTDMLKLYESRVLMDSGEGKHPSGERYTPEDFWMNVGEVRGLRWLQSKVVSMVNKADEADESDRRKKDNT